MKPNFTSSDLEDLAGLLDSKLLSQRKYRSVLVKFLLYRVRESLFEFGSSGSTSLKQWWGHLIGQKLRIERKLTNVPSVFRPSSGTRRSLTPGIAHYGLFRAEIGIGQAARRLAGAIRAAGIPLTLHNILLEQFESKIDFDAQEQLVSPHDTVLLHFNADTFIDLFDRFPLGALFRRRRIGHWAWELPVFPVDWVPALAMVHEVWVPSRFVAETVANATNKTVRLIPYFIPITDYSQSKARDVLDLPRDTFIFLTIFDLNSFARRKNPLGAIRAFIDAFPDDGYSSPILVIKCHGRGHRDEEFAKIRELCSRIKRLVLIDRVFSEEEMTFLRAGCDCLISLHRAEGFGLNIAECMGAGKLVIVTNFSGNTDFTRPGNSLLVPYKMAEVGRHAYIHGAGQWWAEPDHDAAVSAIQQAYSNRFDIRHLASRARADIAQQYSLDAIGSLVKAAWQDELEPFRT
jgi:glycosyltransferase involved in cell wall biosynthesis